MATKSKRERAVMIIIVVVMRIAHRRGGCARWSRYFASRHFFTVSARKTSAHKRTSKSCINKVRDEDTTKDTVDMVPIHCKAACMLAYLLTVNE
jgi:hypothetical protein